VALQPLARDKQVFNSSLQNLLSDNLDQEVIRHWLKQGFQLEKVSLGQRVQSLWSGYGEIVKFELTPSLSQASSSSNAKLPTSVVVKWVNPPERVVHPRGWQSDIAHQRKLSSYQVEMNAYRLFNQTRKLENWPSNLNIPYCHQAYYDQKSCQQVLLLEDLDASGFPLRYDSLTETQILPCIDWLASFHAFFLQDFAKPDNRRMPSHLPQGFENKVDNFATCSQGLPKPFGLWPIGSYWHLATRPDEWQKMPESKLKQKAAALDKKLNNLRFKTLIQGDAKVANFCFSKKSQADGMKVAALDFQYTGIGCGMKDFIYLLGSCLSESECQTHWGQLLDAYFVKLKMCLAELNSELEIKALEQEWRFAFELAWADFQRFLEGWSPTHKKNTSFSRALTASALSKL